MTPGCWRMPVRAERQTGMAFSSVESVELEPKNWREESSSMRGGSTLSHSSLMRFSKPLMTAMTMRRTATPRATPRTEMTVMMEMNVRLGLR